MSPLRRAAPANSLPPSSRTDWTPRLASLARRSAKSTLPSSSRQQRTSAPRASNSAAAGEAWQQVPQLREFDLPLPFARARTPGEDVEDDLRPIHHAAIDERLDVAGLGRGQFVIEDHEVGPALVAGPSEFLQLAAAEERGRIGAVAFLEGSQHGHAAGRRD